MKKQINKSDWIRGQSMDISVPDLIAKAKTEGIELNSGLIYTVRSTVRVGRKPAKKKGKVVKKPAPIEKAPQSVPQSASSFIRSKPLSMKVADVVKAGAAIGMKITPNNVWGVRYNMRVKRKEQKLKSKGTRPKTVKPEVTGLEFSLRKIAFELGLPKAKSIIDALENKMRDLIKAG